MYYLFVRKEKDVTAFRAEFDRIRSAMDEGRTPVFNEMRSAKTNLIETIPYNIVAGAFLIAGTMALNALSIGTVLSVAVIMIVNSVCGCLANYIFCAVKHRLRIRLCKRIGIELTEDNVAAMESMEYQSV